MSKYKPKLGDLGWVALILVLCAVALSLIGSIAGEGANLQVVVVAFTGCAIALAIISLHGRATTITVNIDQRDDADVITLYDDKDVMEADLVDDRG